MGFRKNQIEFLSFQELNSLVEWDEGTDYISMMFNKIDYFKIGVDVQDFNWGFHYWPFLIISALSIYYALKNLRRKQCQNMITRSKEGILG